MLPFIPFDLQGSPRWGIGRQLISESGKEFHHSYGYFKSNQQNVPAKGTHEICFARYYQARRREKQVCQRGYVLFLQDKKEQRLKDLAPWSDNFVSLQRFI